MLHGIIHRFLRDMIEVGGHIRRRESDTGSSHWKRQEILKQIFDFGRPSLSAPTSVLGIRHYRQQTVRQFSGLVDGLVHQRHDSCRVRRFRQSLLRQFLFLHLAHESDARQMLAQTIMQVLPDAPLLFAR